jgi:hypothetical protein
MVVESSERDGFESHSILPCADVEVVLTGVMARGEDDGVGQSST